jgi:epoxyqueuosine reductase
MGFLGKNAMAILPGKSSYFFLAAILVNIPLTPTRSLGDHCGSCVRCLDACPTEAFTAPGQLDARRCISYLTIEHKGPISSEFKGKMGRWVFGCDDCQEICPHNPKAPAPGQDDFAPRVGHAWLDLEWIMNTSDEKLIAHFQGSPIRRPGPQGLKRNASIALGNLGDTAARACLLPHIHHPDPGVSDAVQWALERVG